MKLLKEADKSVLLERALYNVDLLFETEEKTEASYNNQGALVFKNTRSPFTMKEAGAAVWRGWDEWKHMVHTIIMTNTNLTSLKGFPGMDVLPELKDITIDMNPFKSLEGLPKNFTGDLLINDCGNLKNLKGCPPQLREIYLNGSGLESFEGGPVEVKAFTAEHMAKLKTLKGFPKIVREWAHLSADLIKEFDCECDNVEMLTIDFPVENLKNFHKAFKRVVSLSIYGDDIKSHILSLMLVKNLKEVILINGGDVLNEAIDIVNDHLPNDTGMDGLLACQDALMEAGLDQYAKI